MVSGILKILKHLKMKTIYKILLLAFLSNTLFAQTTPKQCNCCTPEYKQFDFWLGEWDVFNLKGVKVGENKIVSMQDSCLIQENWTSSGQTGTSYNFYDKTDNTWNQIYIDNTGYVLKLKGTLQDHKMVLQSEPTKSTKGDFYYRNRIIWEQDSAGNISQKWDIIDEKGNVLQVAFDGIYKSK